MSSSAISGPILADTRRAPAGTAAAPSFAFNDSTGTGVYLVSPGVLGLSTAGVQRVVVDASGNVSVSGTTQISWPVDGGASRGLVTIGTQGTTGSSLFVNTPSLSAGYASGLAVDGSYSSTISTVNIKALGVSSAGGYGSVLAFHTSSGTSNTERARIDASGNLLVGTTSASGIVTAKASGVAGTAIFTALDIGGGIIGRINSCDNNAWNAAATGANFGMVTSTGRSINARGTINAGGADYAEYMTKAGEFTLAKGDLCGVNAEGRLTNRFSEAVAFVVKSTNPSYVGGDTWGADFEDDTEGLEAARQLVDRIAFCGQVPVNVLGATPGQWIIPVEENGAIKGQAVSSPSFEQYQLAVGKVIAVEEDGRARIIVKIA